MVSIGFQCKSLGRLPVVVDIKERISFIDGLVHLPLWFDLGSRLLGC